MNQRKAQLISTIAAQAKQLTVLKATLRFIRTCKTCKYEWPCHSCHQYSKWAITENLQYHINNEVAKNENPIT